MHADERSRRRRCRTAAPRSSCWSASPSRPTTSPSCSTRCCSGEPRHRGDAAVDLQPHRGLRRRRHLPRRPRRHRRRAGPARRAADCPSSPSTSTCTTRARPCSTCSPWPPGWTRWSSARRRSSASCAPPTPPRTSAGTVGRTLHELSQQALRVGKRVHAETGIDAAGASVVSEALAAAARRAGRGLDGRAGVVVGAGPMGALAAAHLRRARRRRDRRAQPHAPSGRSGSSHNARRTGHRGPRRRARGAGGRAGRGGPAWSPAPARSAPWSPRDAWPPRWSRRDGPPAGRLRPRAAPRRRPRRGRLPGVTVVDLATLQRAAGRRARTATRSRRPQELVAEEAQAYLAAQRSAEVTPTVTALRRRADEVVDAELLRLDARLPDLDAAVPRGVRPHRAPRRRQAAAHPDRAGQAPRRGPGRRPATPHALRELFELDPQTPAAVAVQRHGDVARGTRHRCRPSDGSGVPASGDCRTDATEEPPVTRTSPDRYAPHRHPGQRARASPRPTRRRSAARRRRTRSSWSPSAPPATASSRPDRRRSASACSSRRCATRCWPTRSTSPCTPTRTCRPHADPRLVARRGPGAGGPARRARRPRRADPRRAAAGRAVGTGSPRRVAQLEALGLGLELVPIRGNVDTRHRARCRAASSTPSCSPRPGCAGSAASTRSPRCSTRCRCCPRPPRARWRSSAASDDAALEHLLAQVLDDAGARAAVTAERALLARWRPAAAPRWARSPRSSRTSTTTARSSNGCSCARWPARRDGALVRGVGHRRDRRRRAARPRAGRRPARRRGGADGACRRPRARLRERPRMGSEDIDSTARRPPGRIAFVGSGPGDPGLLTVRARDALAAADSSWSIADPGRPRPAVRRPGPPDGAEVRPRPVGDARRRRRQGPASPRPTSAGRLGRAPGRRRPVDAPTTSSAEVRRRRRAPACRSTSSRACAAGTAVPAYAGVAARPGAHRGGRRRGEVVDCAALAAAPGPLVLHATAADLADVVGRPVEHGLASPTPRSRSPRAAPPPRSSTVADDARRQLAADGADLDGPLVVTVGEAVEPARASCPGGSRAPLYGWQVLVPRTKEQAGAMSDRLRVHGAVPEEVPTIAVEPPRTPDADGARGQGPGRRPLRVGRVHLDQRGARGVGEVRASSGWTPARSPA